MATHEWKKHLGSTLVVACLALTNSPEAASDFLSVDEKELVEELVTQLKNERAEFRSTAKAVGSAAGTVGSAAETVRDAAPLLVAGIFLQLVVGLAVLMQLNSIRTQVKLLAGPSTDGDSGSGRG